MLSRLGYLLREILENDSEQLIRLRDELEYIKTYLAIEQTRFQDRLSVVKKIDEKVLDAQIPALILQPIVENAIKHGISTCAEHGEIKLVVEREVDDLKISVTNDFVKINGKQKGYGIGITNTAKRLVQLYGSNFEFIHGEMAEGKYESRITLPYIEFDKNGD